MKPSTKHQVPSISLAGFTLVELSVVLAIIAVVMGSVIALTSATLEGKAVNITMARLKTLQQALYDYRIAYNKLPCPANSTSQIGDAIGGYGVASTSVNCTGGTPAADLANALVAVGMVPVRTLGLPDEMAVDGWGRRIRYAVSTPFTVDDYFDDATATAGSLTTRLTVKTNNAATYAAATTLSATAVFVLISYGKNGHGAYAGAANGMTTLTSQMNTGSTNEFELRNCKCTSAAAGDATNLDSFAQGNITPDPTDPLKNFDDLVVFSNRAMLRDATE